MSDHEATTPRGATPGAPDAIRALVLAIHREVDLLDELRGALVQQRAGVAASDVDVVQAGSDRMSAALVRLDEARAGRRDVLAVVTGEPGFPLADLETVLPPPLPRELQIARSDLARSAREVTQELRINRTVLARSLATGEAFFQTVFQSLESAVPVYGEPNDAAAKPRPGAVLVNRMA